MCRVVGAVVIVIGLYFVVWGKKKDYEPHSVVEQESLPIKQSKNLNEHGDGSSNFEVVTTNLSEEAAIPRVNNKSWCIIVTGFIRREKARHTQLTTCGVLMQINHFTQEKTSHKNRLVEGVFTFSASSVCISVMYQGLNEFKRPNNFYFDHFESSLLIYYLIFEFIYWNRWFKNIKTTQSKLTFFRIPKLILKKSICP